MYKRIISFFLVMCLLLGLVPAGPLSVRAVTEPEEAVYHRDLHILWGEDSRWDYSRDPDTGEEYISGDELPAGVTFADGVLTLENAELKQVHFHEWGTDPVKVVILGENRITGSTDENIGALHFHACHDITIEGGGSVYLESRFIPLHTNDDIPGSPMNSADGELLIRDVSITAISVFPDELVDDNNAWQSSGVSLGSNTVLDGVELYTRGHRGFNHEGDLLITGGTKLDADGFSSGPKPLRHEDDNHEFYRCNVVIEDADLDITVHKNKVEWDYFVFDIGPGYDLTVREGADITVDCSDSIHDFCAFLIHDDYTEGAGAATMTMEGGKIHVISIPRPGNGGIGIGDGAVWTQTGGEVILDALHQSANFCVWGKNSVMNFHGGSILLRGTELSIGPEGVWNQHGGDIRVEHSTAEGCGMWLGRDAAFNMTDGSVTLVNESETVRNGGPEYHDIWASGINIDTNAEFNVIGGRVRTEGDWLMGMENFADLLLTGGSMDIVGIREGIYLERGNSIITGGQLRTVSDQRSMMLSNAAGLTVLGGEILVQGSPLLLLPGSSVRFLDGETILPEGLVVGQDDLSLLRYGEGVRAAYADGTEAALELGELGWMTGPGVTIKSQSVKSESADLFLSLNEPDRVTAGVPAGVKLICVLDEPEGAVRVTLPTGAELTENSIRCNGKPIDAVIHDDGFTVNVSSGSLVTFTMRPSHVGDAVMTAAFGNVKTELQVYSRAYRLTVPNVVNDPTFPLSGTAVAGCRLEFFCDGESMTKVNVSSLGTWSAELTLPSKGYHYIYAILTAADGAAITVTEPYRVLYDPQGIVAESLSISNWLHGNTSLDPPHRATTVIDYTTGKVSPGYYSYWPDLPRFTLTAKFADGSGTPDTIYNVRVLAVDRYGATVTVPLHYDAETDTWVGEQDFCCEGTITPEQFRLQYYTWGGYHDPEEPIWEPDHLPEASVENNSDGAAVLVTEPAEEYTVRLTADAVIESLTDGLGNAVAFAQKDDAVSFPVTPGECYVLRLSEGGFADHPGTDTLSIIIEGENRGEYTYQDNVYPVISAAISDRTDTTFTAKAGYKVGDVLLIDGNEALAVTAVRGTSYSYEFAALDQIFASLDVSGVDTTRPMEVQWGTDKETLLARFRESAVFKTYLKNLEYTLNDWSESKNVEFELGDVNADITLNYGCRDDGSVFVNPVFTITTKMTTKLPWEGELETEVKAELGYTVEENLQYRIRSRNDDMDVQSYMLFTDETITSELHFSVSVGEDPNANEEYFSDFEKMLEELKSNFLEELEEEKEESFNPLKDLKLQIPTPVPAITVFLTPGMEVEWTFFGEMKTDAQVVSSATKGILITHLGDDYLADWQDWSITTFNEAKDPEAELNTTMHLSASLGLKLRIDLGVCVAQCVDLGLFASAGPKVTFNGHGYFSVKSDGSGSSSWEMLAALILEADAGASASLSLKKLPFKLPKLEKELYSAVLPLAEIGDRIMPWEYAVVEGLTYVPSVCDLTEYIDLNLKCQYFNVDGSIEEGKQIMPLDRYEFELLSSGGGVIVTPKGRVTVTDTEKEFDFRVKVTYTGSSESYKIWKIVDLHYSPASLTIHKSAEDALPIATFVVVNVTNRYDPVRTVTTNAAGVVTFPVADGCLYEITEVVPPPENIPDNPYQEVFVRGETSVGFANHKEEDPPPYEPPAPIIPPIGDPSGYVFEGIESNRLEGVTAELYVADDEQGTNARLWDAAPFDQINPMLTDQLGRYQWMVPDGWWQVRWQLEGYDTAESEWMVVPPIRTGVNQNLVTDAPASMTLRWSEEENAPAVLFSRPVEPGSLGDVTVLLDGSPVQGWLNPVDADWSVTDDPLDSRMCATAFRVDFPEGMDILGRTVTVTVSDSITYNGASSGPLTGSVAVPEARSYELRVEWGSGSGVYRAGELVTVTAYENGCHPFAFWECWDLELADNAAATITFPMPEHDLWMAARYSDELVHDYAAHVTAPTCTEGGHTTHTCSRCGESYTDSFTAPLGHDWHGLECGRCGQLRENPFTDVPEDSYCYDPVIWAVARGITNGTSDTTFSPGEQCIRAQVVTFLWRTAGSPEPEQTVNPFVDVKPKDFFYKAVLWAVEQGITNGVDATHFDPAAYCSRFQVVAFLHRSLGSPAVTSTNNPFTDVPDGQWYTAPILWAVENGVTNGVSGTLFAPLDICNRAQIVTFLYRAFN